MITHDTTPLLSGAEILALADKAGLWYPMGNGAEALHTRARLFEFARMVADSERERLTAQAEANAADAARLRAALRELVALEDMRLRLRSLHERGHGTDYENYHKGLPSAWDAARSALGHDAAMAQQAQEPTR